MSSEITLTEEQLKKIHEGFKKGDSDADGKLSWKEFTRMTKDIRLRLTDNQIREIFNCADNDRNG